MNRKGGGVLPKRKIYMAVTKDALSLPLAVADSVAELAELRGVKGTKSSKIKAYKKEIDGLIFVQERQIPVQTAEELTNCQRPLRAQTAQGERNSLASSEEIAAGAKMEFSILVMSDDLVPAVKEWLSYGKLRGLGQWRNSGKGRFLCEILEERAAEFSDILD